MPANTNPYIPVRVRLQSIASMLREIKKDAIALDKLHRDQKIVDGLTLVKKELTDVIGTIDDILGD